MPVWFQEGGWVLWLLAFMSLFAVTNIAYVALRFQQAKLNSLTNEGSSLATLNKEQSSKSSKTLLDRLAPKLQQILDSEPKAQQLRDELVQSAQSILNDMRSGFRSLEVIAASAPLLGLLGTVLGMIEAFKQLAAAGNQVDPAMLSGGIWQALLTTAGGLIVALPALIAWHYFDRQLENTRVQLNGLLLKIERQFAASISP